MADIVVVGRVKRDGSGGWVQYQTTTSNYELRADYGDNWSAWKDTSDYTSAVVNVDVANSSNLDGAKRAAENIARALAELEAELEALPPNTPINWDGHSMTAAQVLNVLNTTKFIVTDQMPNNGGVGESNADLNTDRLYFGAFDGVGTNDYASPPTGLTTSD